MTNHRISDDEAAAVLRGQVPEARPDLESVAHAVAMFRQTSLDSPRPSAELARRLDLERAAMLSGTADGLHASTAAWSPVNEAPTPGTRRRRVALSGFAGLGLAAKIAIGAVAASAVGVAGAGAAGAVGVLPTQAQEVFDQVTGHPGGDHVSEQGLENSQFGLETAEEARQNGEEKREAALDKAAEKRQAGLDTAEDASETGAENSDGASDAGLETAEEGAANGAENAADEAAVPTAPPTEAAEQAGGHH
jgi:hypothetical protein